MKDFIIKISVSLLKYKRFRSAIIDALLTLYNNELISKMFSHSRNQIIGIFFQYPSLINDGYLHITRTIGILRDFRVPVDTYILDIGAAGGQTCILFAEAFPNATVVGFEPISRTFERLVTTTQKYSNIKVHHTALGSAESSATINVMNRITASSLFSSKDNSSLSGHNYFDMVEQEKIDVKRLDDFNIHKDQISLIKMDVQGFELEVLKGATETLKNTYFVLLELQNHDIYIGAPKYFDVDLYMRNSGFELFDMIPSIREHDQIMEFDALYINRSLAKK